MRWPFSVFAIYICVLSLLSLGLHLPWLAAGYAVVSVVFTLLVEQAAHRHAGRG